VREHLAATSQKSVAPIRDVAGILGLRPKLGKHLADRAQKFAGLLIDAIQ
jgi:hypothetical protein